MAKGISILLLFLCVSYAIGNDAPAVQNEDSGLKLANENEDASKLQNDEEYYDQALDLDEGAQSEENESNFEAEETTEADEQGEEGLAEDDNAEENDNTEVASNEDNVNEKGCKWHYVRTYDSVPQYKPFERCHPVYRQFKCYKYVKRCYSSGKRYCSWKKIGLKWKYRCITRCRLVRKRSKCNKTACRYSHAKYLSGYVLRTRLTRKRFCL